MAGGKGLGKGMAGARRHQKPVNAEKNKGLSKGVIKRLARRGGVKRIHHDIYDEVRATLRTFLEQLLHDITIVLVGSGRKTVTVRDVLYALRRLGKTLYFHS